MRQRNFFDFLGQRPARRQALSRRNATCKAGGYAKPRRANHSLPALASFVIFPTSLALPFPLLPLPWLLGRALACRRIVLA